MLETIGIGLFYIFYYAFIAVVLVVIFVLLFLIGWLILIVWAIQGFPATGDLHNMAIYSLYVYGICAGLVALSTVLALVFNRSTWLSLITHFISAPMRQRADGQIDLPDLARKKRSLNPLTRIGQKFNIWRDQKAAADLRIDATYYDAQADLHRAAQAFNQAKIKAEEAERVRLQK